MTVGEREEEAESIEADIDFSMIVECQALAQNTNGELCCECRKFRSGSVVWCS